jgi:hypothetical protein
VAKVRDCAGCIHHYPRNPTWTCELELTPDVCSARLYPPSYVATSADISAVVARIIESSDFGESNNRYSAPDQTRGWQEWASQLLVDLGAAHLLAEGSFDHDAARALITRLLLELIRHAQATR